MIPTLPRTIAELPFFAQGRFPKADMLGTCRGGQVAAISTHDVLDRVRDVGLGLTALGLTRGEPVVLLAESQPDWLIADFAVLACGGIVVPIYPTLSADQVGLILRDSGATVAIVSTAVQLEKIAASGAAGALRQVIALDDAVAGMPWPFPVCSFAEVAALGHRRILDGWGLGRQFHDLAKRTSPDDVATIIYTSGTTGDPKGVPLTHANLVANLDGITRVLPLGPDDVALSFLPLCHAFELIVAYVYFTTGVSMVFAESLDTVPRDLQIVRPTVMTGVPRVFEKLHARIVATGRAQQGLRRRLFEWSLRVAAARGRALENGGRPSRWLDLQTRLADRAVFRRVRDVVGGRLRYAVSGSAPLSPELGRVLFGMGLPVLEGYGLTETSPVLSVVPLDRVRFGTVGRALPNVELRIADDGELLARGPNVMSGYLHRPADTAAALADGWFHTGDIGSIDADGYLRITDRKKELLVTSGGKKIAPQPVEAALCAHVLISDAVLLGDRRHFPAALIVPDFGAVARHFGGDPPANRGDAEAVLRRAEVQAAFAAAVDHVNARLAQFERIKKFTVLSAELTIASGELTPTLKIKRRVIEERYRDEIERMYESKL